MRVAVIGSGIAGCAAAYTLKDVAEVTVYERDTRMGGHAHTTEVDYDGHTIAVDVGFIVYNELNYPNLTALFNELAVETQPSRMSFSVSLDEGRLEWCGRGDQPLSGLFAQRSNAFSPSFWRMLLELVRFQRQSLEDLRKAQVPEVTLGAYVLQHGFSDRFCRTFLLPMGAAIWSMPSASVLEFPVRTFLTFFDNHRLLHRHRPPWRTVSGGSRSYVERLTQAFKPRARLGRSVVCLRRSDGRVTLTDDDGAHDSFDHVVVATNAPQALALLSDASDAERETLAGFKTTRNMAYLHRDARLMPRRRAAWAAWNVGGSSQDTGEALRVTYWMNQLQDLNLSRPLFVSLNPSTLPHPDQTFDRFDFEHPVFDQAADVARQQLSSIQGRNGVWFCGAWTGYGFHEDGLVSGLSAAEAIGGKVSWRHSNAAVAVRAAA